MREGGIAAIVEALDDHPNAIAVQAKACWSLLIVDWSDVGLQRRIKEAGSVELVRQAMPAANSTASTISAL